MSLCFHKYIFVPNASSLFMDLLEDLIVQDWDATVKIHRIQTSVHKNQVRRVA